MMDLWHSTISSVRFSSLLALLCLTSTSANEHIKWDHPSWVHGGHCTPFDAAGGELMWDKLFDVRALRKEANVFVCYDGRYSKEEEATAAQSNGPARTDAVGGGVILVEHFLSDEEIQEMETITWMKSSLHSDEADGAKTAYYVGKQYEGNFDLKAVKKQNKGIATAFDDKPESKALNDVEERIANFLRIPATAYEHYMQLQLSTGPEVHSGGHPHPGIYHVKHNALVRQAAALVYLRGGPNTMQFGGDTVFPGIPRGKPASAGGNHTRVLKKLKGKVSQVMRNLGPDDAWPQLKMHENDKSWQDMLSLCDRANSSRFHEPSKYPPIEGFHGPEDGPILAVAPVRGRALFWWGERPYVNEVQEDGKNISGEIIPDMWHVSCPVIHGSKIAMMKYKNHGPDHENCMRSRWCKESWERIGRAKQGEMEL